MAAQWIPLNHKSNIQKTRQQAAWCPACPTPRPGAAPIPPIPYSQKDEEINSNLWKFLLVSLFLSFMHDPQTWIQCGDAAVRLVAGLWAAHWDAWLWSQSEQRTTAIGGEANATPQVLPLSTSRSKTNLQHQMWALSCSLAFGFVRLG